MTALFPCIACHHLVSRKAIACPNCGHPVRGVLGLLRVISSIRSVLILCGLGLAVALTIAWSSFLSYVVFRLAEFVF